MTTKLRWMTIVVLAVLLSAGPVAALDGARGDSDEAPGVLAWVIQPLEVVWAWILESSEVPLADVSEVQKRNGEEQSHSSPPPGLEESNYLVQPGG